MDSLTQIVLGSTVAALAVPAAHRRRALAAGAALGTLPDLDALPLLLLPSDPVTSMITHRAASHSLLVLPFAAMLLWWLLHRFWQPVRAAPRQWFIAILLALLTHPLLDAFTIYGTQLVWPFRPSPMMWSSLWIIDPAYTLPLIAGVIAATIAGAAAWGGRWLWAGMLLSTLYLSWSLTAKAMVEQAADQTLAAMGLQDAPRFSVPLPLNTLLWQVVVMTDDGYLIGEHSLVADRQPIAFRAHASDTGALADAARSVPALQALLWFNRGFMRAAVDGEGRLVVSDLRMGREPDYSFQFAVARRQGGEWLAITPERVKAPMRVIEQLPWIWHRIFHEPRGAAQQ